jgi:serine/threonine-protein kinase
MWVARVEAHSDGRYAAALKGTGSVVVNTEPPGAMVLCERYERRGLVWPLRDRRTLGTTPLDVALPMGSYRLRLLLPGRAVVTYPVYITRGRRWHSGTLRLPALDDVPPGQTFVPGGPFTRGGDPDAQDGLPRADVHVDGFIAQCLPVTTGEYATFLDAVARTDPDRAWALVPRNPSGESQTGGQYWERPSPGAPYVVPEKDRDGDRWDPCWPVMALSWEDATAYAAWRARRDGLPWRLPTEDEWEKLARGVDGRLYPWGDDFDATLCNMRQSHPDGPSPRVVGSYPEDASVYGARDVAGNQQEFCGDLTYGTNDRMRPTRGGAWTSDGMRCRLTWRTGFRPAVVKVVAGFRLVRSLD